MEGIAGKLARITRIFRFLILLLILLGGIVAGLFVGGGIYVLADRAAPWLEGIPVLGARVYPLLEKMSPPATGYERRLRELEEKEQFLLARSKALDEERASLSSEKKEILQQKARLEKELDSLEADKHKTDSPAEKKDHALFSLVSESFMEMPASKAASIIALLPLEEAASLLEVMDPEQRSQVLGKMSPESAARLVRYARSEADRT